MTTLMAVRWLRDRAEARRRAARVMRARRIPDPYAPRWPGFMASGCGLPGGDA